MKTTLKTMLLTTSLLASLWTAGAADKIASGPKGGRLLEKTQPQAELFVGKDRRVTITFYDEKLKPIPAADQTVTVIADTKEGKSRIEFEKQGDTLVSKTRLPEGEGYNVVVQLKGKPDAKPQNFRFKLELHTCGGCQRAEYACTCDH